MSKRWTYKDDDFLVRYHEIGADYIADHDLGFKAKGAGTRRLNLLRETGLFDLIQAAQDAVSRAAANHALVFSRSEEAKEVAEFALADLVASQQQNVGGPNMNEWSSDMSSAPRDGTDIMLYSPAGVTCGQQYPERITIGHWASDEECRIDIGDCGGDCHCREYEYSDPSWISWDGGFTEEHPPTHWAHLSSAPSKTYSHPAPGDRGGGRAENNEGDTLEGVIAHDDDTRGCARS